MYELTSARWKALQERLSGGKRLDLSEDIDLVKVFCAEAAAGATDDENLNAAEKLQHENRWKQFEELRIKLIKEQQRLDVQNNNTLAKDTILRVAQQLLTLLLKHGKDRPGFEDFVDTIKPEFISIVQNAQNGVINAQPVIEGHVKQSDDS